MREQQPDRPYNVLFLCTGNSARSIFAEAILNKIGNGKFIAYSAGSFPRDEVNPHTLALLERLGYPTDNLRSKSWDEFARPTSIHEAASSAGTMAIRITCRPSSRATTA